MAETSSAVTPTFLSRGALLGVLLGYFGWLLGLTIACAAAGAWPLLLYAWLYGGTLTAALAAGHVVTARLTARAGIRLRQQQAITFGLLTANVGILLAFAAMWLLPRMRTSPALAELLRGTGSATQVPDWLPLVLLAVGAVSLTRAATRLR